MMPALLTTLAPFTRTLAKLGFVPALVCCEPMVAPDWMLTVKPVTPAGATKPVGCASVQVTVCPLVGVAGWHAPEASAINMLHTGTLTISERRST
ncbi:hypothetical protein ASF22_04875 [Methylobacterium sp. Leaf87]|nr:hypothetical protein ASF22_04875 [Methylobacterium sp. Leaf87]